MKVPAWLWGKHAETSISDFKKSLVPQNYTHLFAERPKTYKVLNIAILYWRFRLRKSTQNLESQLHYDEIHIVRFDLLIHTTMTLQQAQQDVDEWIKTVGVRYFNELTNLGILMEEVGELSRIIVRKYGEQSFKGSDKEKNLSDEMADVLWVLLCLANQTGVDLTEALKSNFEKKNNRDATRHIDNEKLH